MVGLEYVLWMNITFVANSFVITWLGSFKICNFDTS